MRFVIYKMNKRKRYSVLLWIDLANAQSMLKKAIDIGHSILRLVIIDEACWYMYLNESSLYEESEYVILT